MAMGGAASHRSPHLQSKHYSDPDMRLTAAQKNSREVSRMELENLLKRLPLSECAPLIAEALLSTKQRHEAAAIANQIDHITYMELRK